MSQVPDQLRALLGISQLGPVSGTPQPSVSDPNQPVIAQPSIGALQMTQQGNPNAVPHEESQNDGDLAFDQLIAGFEQESVRFMRNRKAYESIRLTMEGKKAPALETFIAGKDADGNLVEFEFDPAAAIRKIQDINARLPALRQHYVLLNNFLAEEFWDCLNRAKLYAERALSLRPQA